MQHQKSLKAQAKYLFALADALTLQLQWAHNRGQMSTFVANQWLWKLDVQGMRDRAVRLWNKEA